MRHERVNERRRREKEEGKFKIKNHSMKLDGENDLHELMIQLHGD
jgi:hypothetical protein